MLQRVECNLINVDNILRIVFEDKFVNKNILRFHSAKLHKVEAEDQLTRRLRLGNAASETLISLCRCIFVRVGI